MFGAGQPAVHAVGQAVSDPQAGPAVSQPHPHPGLQPVGIAGRFRPLLADPCRGGQVLQLQLHGPCLLPAAVQPVLHRLVQAVIEGFQVIPESFIVIDSQLGRRGGGRCPQVRHIVRDDRIGLMPHRGYDGDSAVKDSLGHFFLVKSPEVLNRAAAAAYDDGIHAQILQGMDSRYDTVRRLVSLHDGRIQDDLHIGIASMCNIDDVPDRRSCGRCDDAQRSDIGGDGLLVPLIEHSLFFQPALELLIPLVEGAHAVPDDLHGVELVSSVAFIDIHCAADNDLVPFLHEKRKAPAAAGEHDAGKRTRGIF